MPSVLFPHLIPASGGLYSALVPTNFELEVRRCSIGSGFAVMVF